MNSIDILCLQETWLSEKVTDDLLIIKGFQFIRQDRNICVHDGNKQRTKAGGGLLIYIADYLAPYATMLDNCCTCSSKCEQLWIKVSKPNRKICILGTIYRPPSSSVNESILEINSTLQTISTFFDVVKIDLVMLGDFNINYVKSKSSEVRKLKDLERKYHFKQLIKTSTRITHKTKSTIDLIFTNITFIRDSGVMSLAISDHRPVFMIKKQERNKISHVSTWHRTYKAYDMDVWGSQLEADWRWQDFWSVKDDPNRLWDIMVKIFLSNADILYPVKKSRTWKNKVEWVDEEVIRAINVKKRLYKRAVTTRLESNWTKFKASRSRVSKLLRRK